MVIFASGSSIYGNFASGSRGDLKLIEYGHLTSKHASGQQSHDITRSGLAPINGLATSKNNPQSL